MELKVENLTFGYSEDLVILHDINLDLKGPGLVCIIGPNGVGKSTLVKCMNKLLQPTSGNVYIDGVNTADMNKKEVAEKVGFVPAHSWDVFSMPVIDTILVGRHNHQKWRTTPRDLMVVNKTMRLLDIEDLAMRGYNQLSAGQHQKVSLARGLVQETDILILDEPTSNLDVKHQIYVTELLKGISERQEKLIIMISHDLNIAARYADEIIVMSEPGVIHSVGKPVDVVTEQMVSEIYGITCQIINLDGNPQVFLKSVI